MSTQMQTAEGIIKVYDHVTASLGSMLPKPTWMLPSTIYGLKVSGIICLVLLVIYAIIVMIVNNKFKGKEGKKRVTKYADDGTVLSEKTTNEDNVKKTYCDKTYKDGKVTEKICYKKGTDIGKYVMPVTIIVTVGIIFLFVFLFKNLKTMHFQRRLRKQNILHNMFIEYVHKLFLV